MSTQEKLVRRFLSIPKDLTWDELVRLLLIYGYEEIKGGKTGGSRRRFVNKNKDVISLHKSHPSAIVREYIIKDIIAFLKAKQSL